MRLPYFLMVVLLVSLAGCSTTHHYKLLSFFFDGVPNPEKSATGQSEIFLSGKDSALAQDLIVKQVPQNHLHLPYQSRECTSCHDKDKMGKLVKPLPELCYACHDDFSKKYKVLHGPVESGECTSCHSPHMSVNEKLLIRTNQALCFDCHDSKEVLANDTHKDIKDTNCTKCHQPHGGADKTFLR